MKQLKSAEILLVEDNPCDAELTMRALKNQRICNPIVHVSDGEEALEYLFGCNPDHPKAWGPRVILMDLKLPKVDGLEVLKAIRQNPLTRLIPVVILTSSNQECDVLESYRLGANSFLVKPVDSDQYMSVVGDAGRYWATLNEPPGS
ncbi:MAG: response regulator [Deltaproteobacteria bacterium]|nr:response regulator [Deltaproteobacteria bacterium]